MEGLICLPFTSLPLNFHIILTEHRSPVRNSQIVLFCCPHHLTSAKFCLKGKLYSRGGAGEDVQLSNTRLLRAVLADEVQFLLYRRRLYPGSRNHGQVFFFFPMPLPSFLKKTQSNLLTVELSVIYKLSIILPSSIEKPISGMHLGQYIIVCEASQKA